MNFQRSNTESFHLVLTIVLVLLLSGCVSMGRYIKPEKLSLIKEGETTKGEVLALLGNPFMTLPSNQYPGGEIISYSYTRGVPSVRNCIPIVGAISSSTMVKMQQVQIILDGKGVVRKVVVIDQEPYEVRTGCLE